MQRQSLICAQCGVAFEREQKFLNGPGRLRYCSRACRNASYRRPVPCVCVWCGNLFDRSPAQLIRPGSGRFCTRSCANAYLGRIPWQERFWSKVNKDGPPPAHLPELGGCWLWTAGVNNDGYGDFHRRPSRVAQKAHRVSWELVNGAIPDDKVVMHRCDVPGCVRVDHLRLGSKAENNADRAAKGRSKVTGRRKLSPAEEATLCALHGSGVRVMDLMRQFGFSRSGIAKVLRRAA